MFSQRKGVRKRVSKIYFRRRPRRGFNSNVSNIFHCAEVAPTPHNTGNNQHERRQATVPPRLQDSVANRPKRYSSQRQRQVAESGPYQQNQSPQQSASVPLNYYETGKFGGWL